MDRLQEFAENIRRVRRAKRLTQAELAGVLFVTPQTVSKWEKGQAVPDLANLFRLAEVFGMSFDELLGRRDPSGAGAMIAVDGDGNATDFLLFDETGEVLRRLTLGGTNPNAVGMQTSLERLKTGIDGLLSAAPDAAGLFAGIAGSMSGENRESMERFLSRAYPHLPMRLASDIENVIGCARLVGLSDEQSALPRCTAVICSAGSVVYACDGENLHRFGGYGYLFDEGGSGYDIGRAVLRTALEADDGLRPDGILCQAVRKKLGGKVFDRLDRLYAGEKNGIAAFAPLAFEACRQGDDEAERIIRGSVERLTVSIRRARSAYDCGETVVLSGKLTGYGDIFGTMLAEALGEDVSLYFVTDPQIMGAAVNCMRLCGRTADDGFAARVRSGL